MQVIVTTKKTAMVSTTDEVTDDSAHVPTTSTAVKKQLLGNHYVHSPTYQC